MNSNGPYRPILPILPTTSLASSRVRGGYPAMSQSAWQALRAAALLRTSAMRVAEVYGASGDTGSQLAGRVEARRQGYRSYLEDTVVRASPLLLDVASREEIALALRSMMPPPTWPQHSSIAIGWSGAWRSPERVLKGAKGRRASPFGRQTRVDAAFVRAFRAEGFVVRCPSHPSGGLGIRPIGDCLEVMMLIRGTLIVSWGNSVRVTTPSPVPETLAIAARGRLLSELIDSPIFNGREYHIRNVTVRDGVSVFTATARSLPCHISDIFDRL